VETGISLSGEVARPLDQNADFNQVFVQFID
jgi:hypothetical protein